VCGRASAADDEEAVENTKGEATRGSLSLSALTNNKPILDKPVGALAHALLRF